MSQQKQDSNNHTFLDETIDSAILEAIAFGIVWRMKWYEYILVNTGKTERGVKYLVNRKNFLFGIREKSKSLDTKYVSI